MEAVFTRENTNNEFTQRELKFLNKVWSEEYSNTDPNSPVGHSAKDRCIMQLFQAQDAERSAGDL